MQQLQQQRLQEQQQQEQQARVRPTGQNATQPVGTHLSQKKMDAQKKAGKPPLGLGGRLRMPAYGQGYAAKKEAAGACTCVSFQLL